MEANFENKQAEGNSSDNQRENGLGEKDDSIIQRESMKVAMDLNINERKMTHLQMDFENNSNEDAKLEKEGKEDIELEENKKLNNDEDQEEIIKWCIPASITSDDSSSTSSSFSDDDQKTKFCSPIVSEGHKFSDGIVWETIEECDEENISSSESDKPDNVPTNEQVGVTMNAGDKNEVCMKIDLDEGIDGMIARNTHDKISHKPFITPSTHVITPERDYERFGAKVGKLSVVDKRLKGMDDNIDEEDNDSIPEPSTDDVLNNNEEPENIEPIDFVPKYREEIIEENECSLCPDKKELPVSKAEIGNISVKNLAKFWEEVSKKVKVDNEEKEPFIQKKWNSMPNLKERRQLPIIPIQNTRIDLKRKETEVIDYSKVIRSNDPIDDVDLCRSISLRDRKHMYEMMSQQAKKEKAKQWKSMPSLKQQNIKSKVHFEDEDYAKDDVIENDIELHIRGRSPVRELMKNFQTSQPLVYYKRASSQSPVSPLLRTNEIQTKDESLSSTDSFSSSLTTSSLSTVIAKNSKTASLLEDSGGEIYTDSINNPDDQGPYVVDDGHEYSLTPLADRKNKFEQKYDQRAFRMSPILGGVSDAPSKSNLGQHKKLDFSAMRDRVISSNIPYIEEEKDVLKSINIVQSLKTKFLN